MSAHSGYRVPHDRGAVTIGNEAPVWQDRCPGQSRYFRLALADAQQHHDWRHRRLAAWKPACSCSFAAG